MNGNSSRIRVLIPLLFLGGLLSLHPCFAGESTAAISPELLPEDMRDLPIQEEYTPTSFKTAGTIHALEGTVVVLHKATREAYLGSEGDPVHENDEFYTLPETRCRLRFTNEDVVSLAPETRFSVDSYTAREDTGEKSSLFSMVKGKAMFYAMRLFRFKKMRFQVKTPTAVMGVRGTKFGAHVYWVDEKKAESGGIRVADSGGGLGSYLAQTGPGGTPVTVAACGDGSVTVNGITLGPGWTYNSATGAVSYNPGILSGIQQSAGGPGGGDGAGAGGGDEGGDEGGFGGYGDSLSDTLSNITNIETGLDTQETSGLQQQTPAELVEYGYFATMLKFGDDGPVLEDVFLTRTPNTFGEGTEHRADSLLGSDYLIWNDDAYTYVTTDDGTGRSISVTTTATTLDSGLSYLAYGQWEQTGTFTGSGEYAFVNNGWWLQGLATPETAIATQTGSALYSGAAHGTIYSDDSSAAELNGAFSTTVNFDSGSIENFNLDVTDGGSHEAAISGAGGAIAADGTFDLSGGVWTMRNTNGAVGSIDHKEGHGRFFGPNAEEIGGDWAMKGQDTGGNVGAVGVFGGNRN